ncbi:MAG TPA: sigma-70 family RNA polymerase sigma factor [Planctomycetaceae bacterium]|nr:sigma-70 family RNA polymerase sigma factor [Planctomycetaceae bacterium]
MALSEIDRSLLERCLAKKPRAWEDFVDRYMGLVMHVINHTAQCRSILLPADEREDLAAEVMLTIVDNDFAVLRRFRGKSSLATYLTVISRRIVVRKLIANRSATSLGDVAESSLAQDSDVEARLTNKEEVERLLAQLEGSEAQVVRLYHLEGRTYQEISRISGMPANSVGPMLSRIRTRLRDQPHV